MSVKGLIINGSSQKYNYPDLDNKPSAPSGGGLTDDIKAALLQIADKVSYIDTDGSSYYQDLYDALYAQPAPQVASISAVYTQTGTVYDTDTIDSLRTDLVVTAHYDDESTKTVTAYTLDGPIAAGECTITVTYMGKETEFVCTVTAAPTLYTVTNTLTNVTTSNSAETAYEGSTYSATLTTEADYVLDTVNVTMGSSDITSTAYSNGVISIASVTGNITITASATQRIGSLTSIDAVFTQGTAEITNADSLDVLEQYLVVTATWSDSSTSIVSAEDYVLTGTLAVGTSTITVSYGGESDTFTVTVTESALYPIPVIESGRLSGTGNDIVQYTYESAGTRYLYPFRKATGSNSTAGKNSKVFTIPANTTASLTITITAKTGSSAISAGYVWYQVAGTTTKQSAGLSSGSMSTVGQSKTGTFTPEEDLDVGDIVIGLSNATGITFKVTLIAGDVLYIGERTA